MRGPAGPARRRVTRRERAGGAGVVRPGPRGGPGPGRILFALRAGAPRLLDPLAFPRRAEVGSVLVAALPAYLQEGAVPRGVTAPLTLAGHALHGVAAPANWVAGFLLGDGSVVSSDEGHTALLVRAWVGARLNAFSLKNSSHRDWRSGSWPWPLRGLAK